MKSYNIKSLRANEDMTQKDLAEMLDISVKSLQKYESGKTKIPKTVKYSLAYIFHIDASQIRV